ncbi:MAG: hypothetical protein LBS21_05835, partial [Clostridiales bacterium]|nr:hypothetical protein [Clostridiales bacterium]
YVGKYTDFFRSPNAEISGETEYVFSDPLVEQSVRAALGKADGETVTWDELKGVTSLWFLGGYAVNNSQQYWQYNETFDPSPIYADLKDLSDLENCAELSELIINGQTIEDVSALASCYKLRKLHLVNCPNLGDISALASLNTLEEFDAVKCDISDLTPLVHLPLLRALTVIQLPLSDYSAFEQMKNLRQLQVRQVPLQSITELGNLTQMEELTLRDTLIDTLDGIESFGALTKLTLENGEGVRDFSPLNNLPELRELEISADSVPRVAATMSNKDIMVRVIGSNDLLPLEDTAVSFTEPLVEQSVRAMLGMTEGETVTWGDLKDVTELYFLGNDAVTNKEGVERLMRQYDEAQITPSGSLNDLSDFKNMENLRKLVIIGQPVEDLSLLADCPGLFELDLHVCPQLRDISALTQCLQLENLHLLATGVSDLSPLTELPRLNTLRLTRNLDMNFSAVENMDTLRHLVIAQVPLWSLSELGALPRITALELRDVQLDSLNGIENFTALSSLILQRTGNIRDFSPINNLPDLRELTIPVDMELDAAATITRDDVQITLIN